MNRTVPRQVFGSLDVRTPPALAGQRIGLMGGSFNPPHEGHVQVSELALRRLELDRLWWIVSPGNPLKDVSALPPLEDRIARCRELAKDPHIEITGFEAALGTPYTARTVSFLTGRYPGTHFVWLMGADNLAQFHHWRDWRRIAVSIPLAVVDRPGWRLKALASPAAKSLARYRLKEDAAADLAGAAPPAWTFLTGPLSSASSTAIRSKALKKRPS